MSYTFESAEAKKADSRGGVITEIGDYVGKFTRAEPVTAGTGTKGVAFTFLSEDGGQCDFTIYTIKADGTKIGGFSQLMAIMGCMAVRGITERAGVVKKWDANVGARVDTQATVYPDLMGKPIGILLETEDYEKKDKSLGVAMRLAGVFRVPDRFTISEILDRAPAAAALDKQIAGLRHRPLRQAAPRRQAAPASAGSSSGASLADLDDDIPF